MNEIHFHTEDVDFEISNISEISSWIQDTIENTGFLLREINFIFCSDNYLLAINKQYLDHDYYTDIITFDNSEKKDEIEGDIFVSIERIKENAENLNSTFEEELHRVLIHGVLHLTGFTDTSPAEKTEMRKKEDHYLALRKFKQ